MKTEDASRTLSNRQFIAMVRAKLNAEGHADVAVDRLWIDEDVPGYPFLLRVPVGTELILPLKPLDRFFGGTDTEILDEHAGQFAGALVNLKRAERMLTKYARDVRRAANAEIAAARAEGLDLVLDGIGFKPTYAYHLTHDSWKEAAYHVLAEVRVRNTSFFLQPEVSVHWVEEPADVAKELATLREEQRERQVRRAELDALGADLEVDAITLDILRAHDLDAAQVLSDVWRRQCVNLKVELSGQETSLSLVTWDGKVTASIQLEEAYWNGEHLWFCQEERFAGNEGLVGKTLGDLVRHPAFSARRIAAVQNRHRDHISFDLSEKLLFDADTGRIWGEERLAA